MLAGFYHPEALSLLLIPKLIAAFGITCLLASSNYVINEILDAPTDLSHRVKRHRPIPAGLVRLPVAYAEWIVLGAIGLGLAWCINPGFALSGGSACCLWVCCTTCRRFG